MYYEERKKPTYGIILAEGYLQKEGDDTSLIKLIKSDLYPEIVRATAISYVSSYNSTASSKTIKEMLNNSEPIIRERSIEGFNTDDVKELIRVIAPSLNDPIKSVRMAAANKLSGLSKEYFSEAQYKILTKVQEQYFSALMYTSDFPSGKYNLANYFLMSRIL